MIDDDDEFSAWRQGQMIRHIWLVIMVLGVQMSRGGFLLPSPVAIGMNSLTKADHMHCHYFCT